MTGYPITDQEIRTLSDAEANRAFSEHFASATPDYKEAIDKIRSAIDDLEEAAKSIDEAAKAVYGTTEGNKLIVDAEEIRDNKSYLQRLQESMRRSA